MKKSLGRVKDVSAQSAQKKQLEVNKYQNMFISSALSMSWQLAVIVLIPVIGGYEIDHHLRTSPVFLLVGVVGALAGSIGVVYLTLKQANQKVGK